MPTRRAMLLEKVGSPLRLVELPIPQTGSDEVLIRVHTCGICRTDRHIIDGELPHPKLPLILGHQIVGTIEQVGNTVTSFKKGDRVGVPWLGRSCGRCRFCTTGRENLCENALYTGYQRDGGFTDYCVADARFIFPIPEAYNDQQAAPLLCAGLIGYRAYRMVGSAKRIGFYGFGASAHILTQVARHQGKEVYAFTRKGDSKGQAFAMKLGAAWAGSSEDPCPVPLDAAIIFASVGSLVPVALAALDKGGTVVCAGIHMSDIPSFPYSLLWGERVVRSVANLTRKDGEEFLALAPQIPVKTEVTVYPLDQANRALDDLRMGKISGAGVLQIRSGP